MVETVQAGGTLRGYHGASRHKGTAYTTAADREKIVRECLQNGCDYGAAALKYNVDYKALVRWVGQYRAGGAAALHDARHSSEGTSRAKGRERTVPPMQRLVIVLDCLENEKNYGAMAHEIRRGLPPGLPLGAALPARRLARHERQARPRR